MTAAAIRICIESNVELLIGQDSEFVRLFAPEPRADASRGALARRKAQFAAVLDSVASANIARAIVRAKIKAEGHERAVERSFLRSLNTARTVMDVRAIEAKRAEAYWRRWQGTPLRIKDLVPDHWRVFGQRMVKRHGGRLAEKPAQFGARFATHPANACLNFAFAVAAARMTRAIIARDWTPLTDSCTPTSPAG